MAYPINTSNILSSTANISPLKRIEIARPMPGQVIIVNTSKESYLHFFFTPSEHRAVVVGKNLVIEFADGGKVILAGLFAAPPSNAPTVALPDGRVYSLLDFLESLNLDPEVPLRQMQADGSGLPAYDDDPGKLIGDLPRLGMLGTIYWGYGYDLSDIYQDDIKFQASLPELPGGSIGFNVSSGSAGGASGLYEDDQPEKWRMERKDLGLPVPGRLNFSYDLDSDTTILEIRMSGFTPGTEIYLGDPNHGGTLLAPNADGSYTFSAEDFSGPGVFLVPPKNDDTDMQITASVDLQAPDGTMTITDGFTIIVDAVADKPDDVRLDPSEPEITGSLAVSDAGTPERFESGWAEKDITKDVGDDNPLSRDGGNTSDLDVTVSIPVTLEAQFFDFDGSETHALYLEVPAGEGWTCTLNGVELQIVTNLPGLEGIPFFLVPRSVLSFDADGRARADVVLHNNRPGGMLANDSSLELKLIAVAVEHPTDLELTDRNNVAFTENKTTVTLDSISSGLTVRVGWASESGDGAKHGGEYDPATSAPDFAGATEGGEYARIALSLSQPTAEGQTALEESITQIILSCDPAMGTLVGSDGNPLPLDDQGRVILSGPGFISADGQSLVPGSVLFKPAEGYSDADLEGAIKFSVTVTSNSSGASAVFTGSSTVVIDAVADRPDCDPLDANYGSDGSSDYVAATPGSVVNVSGSVSFHDLDGSELLYAVVAIPDSAWGVAGLTGGSLLNQADLIAHWRAQGNMPPAGQNGPVDAALSNALGIGSASSGANQYLLLEYDPESGAFTVYVKDASGSLVSVDIPGLTINYDNGVISFTVPVQTPDAAQDASLEVQSQAVSLEKASGGREYDYSNNISSSEETGTVTIEVEAVSGKLTASLAMYEDGRPSQNQLAPGQDPATGSRDDSTETGWNESTGMPIAMQLEGAAEGEYLYSITIGQLPDPAEGVLYYNGVPVREGQVIELPEMDGPGVPGFSFKPAPNFSGNVDFNFQYVIASHRTGPSRLPEDGGTVITVDSVADLASGQSEFDGREGSGNSVTMPDAAIDGQGWAVQTASPEQSVDVTFTVSARFTDLDGSETAWLEVELPQGFSIPPDLGYELVTRNGVNFARVPVPDLASLQNADGRIDIPVTLRMDSSAAESGKTLQIYIVTQETDTLDGNGHSTANNTAERIISQEIPVSVHSGLTVKVGWASEGADGSKFGGDYDPETSAAQYAAATEDGTAANISIGLNSATSPLPDGSYSESISSIVISYDASLGTLIGADGNPLSSQTSGTVTITLSGPNYISADGQSLIDGALSFRPSPGYSDADLNNALNYEVHVSSVSGEEAVYSGATSVVIDAVADRPDCDTLSADYGSDGSADYVATTPGGVVPVSGSASFHDLDGSEFLYAVIAIPDAAWSVAGLGNSQLLSRNDLTGFWREQGNMPAAGASGPVDAALNGALTIGGQTAGTAQYLLLQYDPETGGFSVYARGADESVTSVNIPGLTVNYANGTITFTVPVQSPETREDGSLEIQSQAVSLEKASGGREYDYSNNISSSEDTGSVTIQVETLSGEVTASLSMYEDGRPNQNQLAAGQDPATGSRDDATEPGYSDATGMPVTMELVNAAPGEYLHSITIGQLPDPNTQGTFYYQGVPVTEGQVIDLPAMNGNAIPGFTFKPAPNFSGDVNLNFDYVIASHRTGPAALPEEGTSVIAVDSVADLASGQSEFDGRDGTGNSIIMPGASVDNQGWSVQTAAPEQSVDFTFTVNALFTDLDGSEIAWLEIELPQGFSIPPSSGYELVTRNGVNYARIQVEDLTGLQGSGGRIDIPVTLRMDSSASESGKTLQIHIFTRETDTLNNNGHSTANNTAERVIGQEITVSVHSGLTVKAGWASESGDGGKFGGSYDPADSAAQYAGATEDGTAANISIALNSATPPLPDGSYSESISSIVITYDASLGTLIGADGNPLSNQTSGMVSITLTGPDYISADGQSLINGALTFRPSQGYSDADLTNALSYEVHVSSVSGEQAVYTGSTTIVIDAVADRPDTNSMSADYGSQGNNDFDSATPGAVVAVSGSAAFQDLDGSELLYTLITIPDSAWSIAGLDHSRLLNKNDISAFWRAAGGMPPAGADGYVDAALAGALTLGNPAAGLSQYLLLEYDPETGTASVYARDASGAMTRIDIPGLTISYNNGTVSFTLPIQTPSTNENASLVIQSQAVSLEKGSGGIEYDYSNNISASDDLGSVEVVVESIKGELTATVSLHEDGRPGQYQLGSGQDPASGSRDDSIESGYSDATGMPVSMQLTGADPGSYVYSITISQLPDPASQGTLYYNGQAVSVGQVISLPAMNGASIPGFSFKPAPNYSGDLNFGFNYEIASSSSGPAMLSGSGTAPIHVDSVADLASGQSEFDGRQGSGNTIAMPGATLDGEGWSSQTAAPEQTVDFTFTVNAQFTDLDGSEIAWIEVELPPGFGIPPSSGYELVTRNGVNFARVPVQDLTGLQGSGGSVNIPVTLRVDATATGALKTLQIHIFTQETDTLNSNGHSTANNTAERVISQDIPVSLHSGLTVKAGWASEGGNGAKFGGAYDPDTSAAQYADGTEGGSTANISIALQSATAPLPGGAYSETITSITFSYDASKGTLIGADGNPLSAQTSGTVTVTLSGADYISADGQSLINGSLTFRPSAGYSDADLTNVLNYQVRTSSVSGEQAVYSGSTSVVIDAVADRPDSGTMSVEYGHNAQGDDYLAVTPGTIVPVNGSAAFHDLDGSELLYALIAIPNSAWSVAGLDNSQLLSRNDVISHWREMGNMPAAGANGAVDMALANAATIGSANAAMSQFLMLEYDPQTGGVSVYARDAGGNMVKVDIPNLNVSYNNGTLSYTLPLQTPTAYEDASLTIVSQGVSLEKGTGGTEYDYSNNISASENSSSIPIQVERLLGTLTGQVSVHEDGMPYQNQVASGQPSDTGPRDERPDQGYDPALGMPVDMQLRGADNGTYVTEIIIRQIPDPVTQGTLYYNGVAVTMNQVITAPAMNGFAVPGFTFKPAPNYSGELSFNFDYTIASTVTGPGVLFEKDGSLAMHVDSVADLASGQIEAGDRIDQGNDFTAPAAVVSRGWAEQSVGSEQSVDISFTVKATFTDLDGSENAWILVELPQGFTIPQGSGYEAVTQNGVNYAKIPVPALTSLVGTNGYIEVPVSLSMGPTASSGSKNLEVRIVTQETDTLNSDGHSTTNNTAERVISQEVDVDVFTGQLTVRAGWSYEDNNHSNATQNLSQINLDPDSTSASGAPIIFQLDSGHTMTGLQITLSPAMGTLLLNGAPHPNTGGVYTFTQAQLQGGSIVFVPSGNHSDIDAPFSYVATVQDGRGSVFTVRGNSFAAVDSVAQEGSITGNVIAAAAQDNTNMDITVNAAFPDIDGSERHFILVEQKPGWTCNTPNQVVTIYVDANGVPLQPTGYDSGTGMYTYDTSAGTPKTFFRIDVTGQSIGANGGVKNYIINMTPPAGSADTTLQIGTLAEEIYGHITDREYDIANNQAFLLQNVPVNLLNSTLSVSATGAYEDHQPNQNTGSTATVATDGIITVAVSNNGEYIDITAGKTIVMTFSYAGPGDPGTFTFNGTTYTLGSGGYVRLPSGDYQLTLPADSFAPDTSTLNLRYNAPPNCDLDLTNLTFSVPVKSKDSGYTATLNTNLDRLVVDAVADKPENVGLNPTLNPPYTAAVTGSVIDVSVQATFGDYQDGSEDHFLVFDLTGGFAGIDTSSFPPGYTWTIMTPAQIQAAGLGQYADNANYVVIQVPNQYLVNNNGVFSDSVRATLDTVTQDRTVQLEIKAVAVESPADSELTTSNNYSETSSTVNLEVHTITSQPVLHASIAYENDTRQAHIGQDGSNGAPLSITGMHSSEGLTDITLSLPDSAGTLIYNGGPIAEGNTSLGNGLILNLTISGGEYVVRITGGSPTVDVAAQVGRLSFVPANNYSDADVTITASGTIIDKASGMTQPFNGTIPVIVDAVAQQPLNALAEVEYNQDAQDRTAAYNQVTLKPTATFRDTQDGSENHYLVIEVKDYFSLPNGTLMTSIAFDNQGNPLTPAPGGGWLNPNAATDVRVTPATVKNFILISVDAEIGQYDINGATTQVINGFSITRNGDGSYTVSCERTIDINADTIHSDFTDSIIMGGRSREPITPPGTTNRESYYYNNVGYGLKEDTLNVAVVETQAVSLLMGFAYEQNSPTANTGIYDTGTGAGILVVRTTPDGQPDYANEQITVTFTYNALYQEGGQWVLPGLIEYKGQPVSYTVDPATGLVTATLTVDVSDLSSILDSTAVSSDLNTRNQQINGSQIRFVPSTDTYNEGDVNLNYAISVEDTASGATKGMGNSAGTVIIDAVADKPVITDAGWVYGTDPNTGQPYTAFASAEVTLGFTATFPDTGTNGIVSEGQYILVQQIEGITLSQSFRDAVTAAGMNIDVYPVGGNLYYRIPAAYFTADPPGSHSYRVVIELTRTTAVTDGTGYTAPIVRAMSIIENPHGGEPVVGNNVSTTDVALPDLDFAVVDTQLPSGGSSITYEDDNRNANIGAPGPDGGVRFGLGLNLGGSINNGRETAGDITFTYASNRGTLAYTTDNGTTWIDVPTGGTVPSQYSESLRYTAKNTGDSTADLDVPLNYSVTVTDPASGASKTLNNSYLIIVDAVAEKPTITAVAPVIYNDEVTQNGELGYNESVTLSISANFPDFGKVAGGHTDLYLLIQMPGSAWTTSYPGATEYIYNGVSYFRLPIDASALDGSGNVTVTTNLIAPDSGNLLFNNSRPLEVFAQSVARDPNKNTLPTGDREVEFGNNFAYSDRQAIDLNYDDGDETKFFTVDPLYQNNNPDGNLLNADGTPVNNEAGGIVRLHNTYTENNTEHTVNGVTIHWTEGDGDLYVGGVKVTPTPDPGGNGRVSVTIPQGDFGNVYFRGTNPNSDTDFNPVTVDIHTPEGDFNNADSFTPIVDAVAQVPTEVNSEPDYNIGPFPTAYTAAAPGDLAFVTVSATFHDLDTSEQHYILVENSPNWVSPNPFPTIEGPDGKEYIQIPVFPDPVTGIGSAVLSTIAPSSGGTDIGNGRSEFSFNTGAMSVQYPQPAPDQEYRSDNNVAYNLGHTVNIVTSRVESNPVLNVTNTYANGDVDGDGVPDQGNNSNVYLSGLNPGSDTVTEVRMSYSNSNGDLFYNGTSLTSGSLPGVSAYDDGSGNISLIITNDAIINALASGNSGSSAIQYVSNNYVNAPVPIQTQVTVQDNFSSDSKTVNSNPTILVDAVARKPENVSAEIVNPDYNGAVQPNTSVTFQVKASFPDLGVPGVPPNHYLALQQIDGWSPTGPLPAGVTIQTYNGVTYYLISADTYGPGGSQTSPALTYDANTGLYTFTLQLTSPNSSRDQDLSTIQGGALTTIDVPNDLDLKNNLNIVADNIPLKIGLVETTQADFVFSPVVEDDPAGSAITLSPDTLNALSNNNEKVTQTQLTISGDFSGKTAGQVVGTVIYDGKAYAVTATGNGTTAQVNVDFGTDGYDPSKEFKMVWGAVQTNSDGTVVTDNSGNPVVNEWNHTGGNMTVNASSTIVDKASNDTQAGVTGTGSANFTPTADAPTGLAAGTPDPVGAGSPVSFTLSGTFADIDGSEQHYFLVEQKPGWTGNYQTVSQGGVTYFMVPAPGNVANPTVTVNLTSPDDVASDQTATLKTGGLAYDGASSGFTQGPEVNVNLGVVDSTGVSMTMAVTDEDVPSRVTFAVVGGNNDGIQSITVNDLKGGSLVDAQGNTLVGPGQLPATLDMGIVNANGYYYKPPAYASGDFDLGFDAVVADNASGASKNFTGLSGSVTVNPVTNAPENAAGTAAAPEQEAGHTATVEVNLNALFVDNDGSEDHFFLVSLPTGATPPAGWSPITDAKLLTAAGLTGQTVYRVNADASGAATLTVTLPQNYGGGALSYKAGSVESATLGDAAPDYKFMDGQQIALPTTSAINYDPTVASASGAMDDALRNPGQVVSGQLTTGDADGDAVTVSGVSHDGIQGTESNGVITVVGTYGTLEINTQTGEYSYTLGNSQPPNAFPEVFAVTVSDGHGGTATANITVTLNAPNSAPNSSQPVENAGGTYGDEVTGNIALTDPDNDPVSIASVRVNGTEVTAGAGGVYTHDGAYGTFEFRPNGSYTYTLTDTNATGVDVLSVTLSDSFGATSTSMVTVNVSPEAAGRAFSLAGLLEQDIYDDAILPWHAEYGPALHLLSGLGSAEVSYPEWGSEAASSVASGEFGLGIEDPGANLDLYLENAAAGAIQTGHEALGYTEPVNMAADHYIQDNGGFHNGDMFADSIEESLTLARINLGLLE